MILPYFEAPPVHVPTMIAPRALLEDNAMEDRQRMEARFSELLPVLRASVGEPFFAEGGFVLYQGDCREVLSRLARSSARVDLTVTSPPYNIGKAYESVIDLDRYIEWCASWAADIAAVTADNGAFWLNLGYLEVPGKGVCVPIAYLLWDRTPFHLVQEVVWHYGAGVTTRLRFCPRNEKWLYYVKNLDSYVFNLDAVRDPRVKYPNQKKNGKLRCNPLGKNPSDVWDFPKVTTGENRSSKERTDHPAQFPVAVIDRIVRVSSDVGSVVLDPFSGSASSGIAAVGNNRVYIGVEMNADYCRMSVERFRRFVEERDAAGRQGKLL